MKVRSSVKKRCKNCYIVKRNNILFILCKIIKHKQKQN